MAQTAYSDSTAEGSGLSAVGEVRLTPDDSTRIGVPWCGHEIVMCDFYLISGASAGTKCMHAHAGAGMHGCMKHMCMRERNANKHHSRE